MSPRRASIAAAHHAPALWASVAVGPRAHCPRLLARLGARLTAVTGWMAGHARLRRDAACLERMTDRQLLDIGLQRPGGPATRHFLLIREQGG